MDYMGWFFKINKTKFLWYYLFNLKDIILIYHLCKVKYPMVSLKGHNAKYKDILNDQGVLTKIEVVFC